MDDDLGCAVSRAQSINYRIMSHFSDPDETEWNDASMTNACWTLQRLLEQIEILSIVVITTPLIFIVAENKVSKKQL